MMMLRYECEREMGGAREKRKGIVGRRLLTDRMDLGLETKDSVGLPRRGSVLFTRKLEICFLTSAQGSLNIEDGLVLGLWGAWSKTQCRPNPPEITCRH
jgi:hypothetical protein